MPPASLARLNAVSRPSFIWLPSSFAAPVNGADMPKRTSVLVTPRTAAMPLPGNPLDGARTGPVLGCGEFEARDAGLVGTGILAIPPKGSDLITLLGAMLTD